MTASIAVTQPAAARPVASRTLSASALPTDRLHFGLASPPGDFSWLQTSGVPWKYRYTYLSAGVNTSSGWETWNTPSGAYATFYMNATDSLGAIPVFSYYEMLQSLPSTGSTELDRDYSNLNNTSTMNAYYANFALLMSKASAFGKPVVVQVEPDLFGYMEHKAAGGDASTVSASVASSGYAGLSALPNTFQGFSWALLKLRDSIAPNVILAPHASTWASGVDIGQNVDPTFNLAADADKVAAFLNSAGVASNPYGSTFDVVFNDVSDNDAALNARWWDRNDVILPDFQQWLTWMTELHAKTARPLIEWQVPVGNQYFDTMNNSTGHTQDNRVEYFLSHGPALTAAGIIAVLVGSGGNGGSTYTDAKGDGVTNPAPISTFECNLCNNHASVWPDDDGGYLRIFVGLYYGSAASPAITSLVPHRGSTAGGTSVTINGSSFSGATAVAFGGTAATSFSVVSAAKITAVSPAHAAGNVDIAVTTAAGTSAAAVVDLEGFYAPSAGGSAGEYVSVTPARITDTRSGSGQANAGTHLGQGSTLDVQVTGAGGIPASGVSAVVMNVTATSTSAAGFFTVFPLGVARPLASNLNWTPGVTVPNRVIVPVGAGGKVSFYNGVGSADLIVDVNGYFTDSTASGASFTVLSPTRIVDTRNGTGGFNSALGPGQSMVVTVAGSGGVPNMASVTPPKAVVLNVTVDGPTAASDLVVWPDGTSAPVASDLNFVAGQAVPNLVIVKLSAGGKIDIRNDFGSTSVIVDVVGWYG